MFQKNDAILSSAPAGRTTRRPGSLRGRSASWHCELAPSETLLPAGAQPNRCSSTFERCGCTLLQTSFGRTERMSRILLLHSSASGSRHDSREATLASGERKEPPKRMAERRGDEKGRRGSTCKERDARMRLHRTRRSDLLPRRFGESQCDAAKRKETAVSRCVGQKTVERSVCVVVSSSSFPTHFLLQLLTQGPYLSFWRLQRHAARR